MLGDYSSCINNSHNWYNFDMKVEGIADSPVDKSSDYYTVRLGIVVVIDIGMNVY